ncbi:MAG: hypothetical protein ACFE9S_17130 [Candidatus Hermodarchaeota archaeon]
MSENLIDLILGIADGRLIHFTINDEKSKPQIVELIPKTNKYTTAVLRVLKIDEYYCIPSAGGTVNIWKCQDNQWQHYKELEIIYREDHKTNWEVTAIDNDDEYLYTGSPKGIVEIWNIKEDFEKVDEISYNKNPISGILVNDEAIFYGAGGGRFIALNKEDRSEIHNETFPWTKYTIQNMIMCGDFLCIALTGRVFSYYFDKVGLKVEKKAEFPNTHNRVKGMYMSGNICYSAAWDGIIGAWDIINSKPALAINTNCSLESICADDEFIYAGGHHGELIIIKRGKKYKVKHTIQFGREVKCIIPSQFIIN